MIVSRFVEVINPIVPIFASMAEEDQLPYAVYDIIETPTYSKKGELLKITGNVSIYVVAATYDNTVGLTDKVINAISGLRANNYLPVLITRKTAVNEMGQWVSELIYNIIET